MLQTPSALARTDDTVSRDGAHARPVDPPLVPERRLTVLIAAPTLDLGAADEGAIDLACILAAAGHRPILVSQGGRLENEIARIGAVFVRLDTSNHNPLVIARNAVTLRRIVQAHACDIVHAHGRAPGWSAWLAARLCGVPFITSCYAGFREQNILKRWYNKVIARGDQVIAASEQIAQLLTERYGVPAQRISVVRASLDLAPFDPGLMTDARIAQVRGTWGVSRDMRVILVPGRIIRRAGHHVVVRAAARLRTKGVRDFVFVFAGEDEGRSHYSGDLWDLVLATNTAEVVRICGPLADRAACYAAATMVVSAATQLESVPRELLEAMATAKPVIASHLAAGPETVRSPPATAQTQTTGLRFQAGDDAALAAALLQMMSCPEAERQAMGRRARAVVLAEFDRAGIAERMLAAYARVSGARAARNDEILGKPSTKA